MSHEAMIENIKSELANVDVRALQSILEIINQSKRKPSAVAGGSVLDRTGKPKAQSLPLKFIGENLTPEEYERLSIKERCALQERLQEQNRQWLHEKFSIFGLAWLVVVDGEIIASGKSLKDEPMPLQIQKICRETGKFPLVFINESFLAIEEGASTWHETNEPGDYYPTLPVKLISDSNAVEVVGDFDTGASHTFVDQGFLIAQNLFQPEAQDYYKTARHLNQTYGYVAKSLRFGLASKADETQNVDAKIYCVADWHNSPFVQINPERVALIGRDLLLTLKPKVLLDFDNRQTEIVAPPKTAQTHKKTVTLKKRRSRSRR
jgi:hypothetical protein